MVDLLICGAGHIVIAKAVFRVPWKIGFWKLLTPFHCGFC